MDSDRFDRSRLKIAPSLLSADFSCLGEEVRAVEAQGCDWIHVDVMDGHFVPNLTMGPGIVAALRRHVGTVLDVHLMTSPADPWIGPMARAGADVITIHAEAGPHPLRLLEQIRELGCRAGLSLNPGTPESAVAYCLDHVDLVQVMMVNPGLGGQALLPGQVKKIAALRRMLGDRAVNLEVDGGITTETAAVCRRAGADVLVAGSSVFRGGTPGKPEIYGDNIAALRRACDP